jgi:uracil-DNA glycosylase family 4
VSSVQKNTELTSGGCELPEELRRYYLDTMGIQVWDDTASDVQVAAQISTPVRSPADLELWKTLQQTVTACTLCELHQSRTQTVFGVGDQQADLLVIGEAPGRDEDEQGEPFVGRAGQLLTAMLLAIGLQRDDVYIANILKCRPPNNRDPEATEIDSCSGYLRQQIELIQPRAIFAVGRIAAQALLHSTATIGSMRGKQHSYEGVPLIASYHPAYLLRKPSEKRKSWQDLLLLKGLLDKCQ